MFRRIRGRLLVPLGVLILATFGVAAWSAVVTSNRESREVISRVAGVARTLGDSRFPLTDAVLTQMKGLTGADMILVAGNHRVASTFDVTPTEVGGLGSIVAPAAGDLRRVRLGGEEFLCESIRLKTGHPNAGQTLFVLYPKRRFDAEVAEAVRLPLILGVTGAVVAVGLMIGVAHRLVTRIGALRQQTRRIADGDFRPMQLASAGDELWDLGRAVNDMADQLRLLQDRMKTSERLRLLGQVSGGLAHQLRNAVTGAKLAVQVHARSCTAGDAEALEVAGRQLSRIEADLARYLELGADRPPDPEKPHRLATLTAEAVALMRPQCRHWGVDLRWVATADPLVVSNAGRLGHAIVNLLTNAITAAGPGGWVEVAVRQRAAETCIVEVKDSGPGPPPELTDRLGEPFVTGKSEGVGLGVFVARQAVAADGGRLTWRRESAATVFKIELPVRAPVHAATAGPSNNSETVGG